MVLITLRDWIKPVAIVSLEGFGKLLLLLLLLLLLYSPFLGLGHFFSFFSLHTVARPLPTHRTT
jgi:hypothetical protein